MFYWVIYLLIGRHVLIFYMAIKLPACAKKNSTQMRLSTDDAAILRLVFQIERGISNIPGRGMGVVLFQCCVAIS